MTFKSYRGWILWSSIRNITSQYKPYDRSDIWNWPPFVWLWTEEVLWSRWGQWFLDCNLVALAQCHPLDPFSLMQEGGSMLTMHHHSPWTFSMKKHIRQDEMFGKRFAASLSRPWQIATFLRGQWQVRMWSSRNSRASSPNQSNLDFLLWKFVGWIYSFFIFPGASAWVNSSLSQTNRKASSKYGS